MILVSTWEWHLKLHKYSNVDWSQCWFLQKNKHFEQLEIDSTQEIDLEYFEIFPWNRLWNIRQIFSYSSREGKCQTHNINSWPVRRTVCSCVITNVRSALLGGKMVQSACFFRGSATRAAILYALEQRCPSMLGPAGFPARALAGWLGNHRVNQGVQQGAPFGPLLFASAIQAAFDALPPGGSLYSGYLDDGVFMCVWARWQRSKGS